VGNKDEGKIPRQLTVTVDTEDLVSAPWDDISEDELLEFDIPVYPPRTPAKKMRQPLL
jgi:hypothetical protein